MGRRNRNLLALVLLFFAYPWPFGTAYGDASGWLEKIRSQLIHFTGCSWSSLAEIPPASSVETELKASMRGFVDELHHSPVELSDKYKPLLDAIYELYQLAATEPDASRAIPWLERLRSFDDFVSYFAPQATPRARAYLARTIQAYRLKYHPEHLAFGSKSMPPEIIREALEHGDFVEIGDGYSRLFIDRSVAREMAELKRGGFSSAGLLHHDTASGALEGIGAAGAILSAEKAIQQAIPIRTGEQVSSISVDGVPIAGGLKGLPDIYASAGHPPGAWSFPRWLDDYALTFWLDVPKPSAGESILVPGEIKLGERVGLDRVRWVSAPKRHETEVLKWLQQHSPHTKFISSEALRLIVYEQTTIDRAMERSRLTGANFWAAVAGQARVTP